jgi:hypothetical protein
LKAVFSKKDYEETLKLSSKLSRIVGWTANVIAKAKDIVIHRKKESLQRNESFLDLAGLNLIMDDVSDILSDLPDSNVTSLDLSGNRFVRQLSFWIVHLEFRDMKLLNLGNVKWDVEYDLKSLLRYMEKSFLKVETLNLSNTGLNDNHLILIEGLLLNPFLQTLDLSENGFSEEGCETILGFLEKSSVTRIKVDGCKLGSKTFALLEKSQIISNPFGFALDPLNVSDIFGKTQIFEDIGLDSDDLMVKKNRLSFECFKRIREAYLKGNCFHVLSESENPFFRNVGWAKEILQSCKNWCMKQPQKKVIPFIYLPLKRETDYIHHIQFSMAGKSTTTPLFFVTLSSLTYLAIN